MRSRGVASAVLVLLVACGGPPERPVQSAANDGVPANSASEARMTSSDPATKNEPAGKPSTKPPTSANAAGDPTAPYVQKVGEPDPTAGKPEPAAGKPEPAAVGLKKDPKKGEKGEKGEKISKAECELVLDKLLTIEFDSNPELASVPSELRKQVMQQAKDEARQKDNADCNATKAQYKCAMAAATKPQWMACMK